MNDRRCAACGEPLLPWLRADARTCGDRCRQGLSRSRRAAARAHVTAASHPGRPGVLTMAQDAIAGPGAARRAPQP